jgi:hypothetical protein
MTINHGCVSYSFIVTSQIAILAGENTEVLHGEQNVIRNELHIIYSKIDEDRSSHFLVVYLVVDI